MTAPTQAGADEADIRASQQRHVREVLGRRGAELIAAYEAGASVAALAADAGICENTLRTYFIVEGVSVRRLPGRSRTRLDARKAELIAAYEAGTTVKSLAAEVGVSPYTLRAYLLAEGIALRRYTVTSRRRFIPGGTEIVAAYEAGTPILALAARAGVSPPTIRAFLIAKGVALRHDRGRHGKRRAAET